MKLWKELWKFGMRKFFRRKIENKKRTFRKRQTRGEIERQRRNINTRGKKKVIRVVKINKEKNER